MSKYDQKEKREKTKERKKKDIPAPDSPLIMTH